MRQDAPGPKLNKLQPPCVVTVDLANMRMTLEKARENVSTVGETIMFEIVLIVCTLVPEKELVNIYQAELDAYLKGKGKGKSKGLHVVSWDDGWYGDSYENYGMFKGKGKYGKNVKGKYKPSLNTYVMDYDYHSAYCLELFPLELFSTSQPSTTGPQRSVPLGFGMLDCGATASAGPESSAKLLISKLREIDPQIGVHLDDSRRPYFRYGSGQWGQSLYHLTLGFSEKSCKNF